MKQATSNLGPGRRKFSSGVQGRSSSGDLGALPQEADDFMVVMGSFTGQI